MTLDEIITAAKLCAASYDDSDVRFTTIDELRVGVFPLDDRLCIVHRGTYNWKGWMFDFDFFPAEDFDGSHVHDGFLRTAIQTLHYIYDKTMKYLGMPIDIYGHSLGGSDACETAKRLVHAGHDVRVVTFGCPPYQYAHGPDSVPIRHWRIMNRKDPVVLGPKVATFGELTHIVKPFIDVYRDGDVESIDLHAPLETAYIPRLEALKK